MGRRPELRQDIEGRERCGIAHQRQINEAFYRAGAELGPDPLILAPSLVFRRVRRPVDAQVAEIVETDCDRAAALIQGRVKIHLQARDAGSFDRRCGTGRQHRQALLGFRQCTGEELTFGPVQFQLKDQVVLALPSSPLPAVPRRRRDSSAPRHTPSRSWRALPAMQIQLCDPLKLLS